MRAALLWAGCLGAAAGSAGAQSPSESLAERAAALAAACEPVATVQYEHCAVETVSRCPDGSLFAESRERDALDPAHLHRGVGHWSEDGATIFSGDPEAGTGLLRVVESRDPYSFGSLMATGAETYDVTMDWRFILEEPLPSRFWGEDRLTGETVVIDGRRLLRAEETDSVRYGPDGPLLERRGEFFVDAELGLTLSGIYEETFAGTTLGPLGGRPAAILRPGEPGFGSLLPAIGCGQPSAKERTP